MNGEPSPRTFVGCTPGMLVFCVLAYAAIVAMLMWWWTYG